MLADACLLKTVHLTTAIEFFVGLIVSCSMDLFQTLQALPKTNARSLILSKFQRYRAFFSQQPSARTRTHKSDPGRPHFQAIKYLQNTTQILKFCQKELHLINIFF